MGALQKIRDAGFAVSLVGDVFEIEPASVLTPNQRVFLKSHRAEIIEELQAETSMLSANRRQTLLDYMATIGEDDPAMIDEYLSECASDPGILAEQLQQARDYLQVESGDTTGMVQCSGCKQLTGDQCQLHGWRVVIGKWRRCSGYIS